MNSLILKLVQAIYRIFKGVDLSTSTAYNPEKLEIMVDNIVNNMLMLVIFSTIMVIVYRLKKKWFIKAAILITFFDLFFFSKGNLITIPIKVYEKEIKAATWLKRNSQNFRYYSTNGNFNYTGLGVYWTHLMAREPFSPNEVFNSELSEFERLEKILSNLPENQGIMYRISDVSGYAASIPKNYLYFWEKAPQSPNAPDIQNLSTDKLDKAGVKYIITGYPKDFLKNQKTDVFKLVFENDNSKIYENLEVWPRSFLIKGKEIIPARIIKYSPTNILIDFPKQEEDNYLVLTDASYPGWKAYIDGKETKLEKFQDTFRKVKVPAEAQQVNFKFESGSFRIGAIISFVTFISLVTIFIWRRKISK